MLAGTIKDVVGRYYTQLGFHVDRRFGWDTHGLPIEFEIEKQVKNEQPDLKDATGRDIVETLGLAGYNEKCRSIVMTYADEWRKTVERAGRWVDFDRDYKTMEKGYMESLWWVFAQLYEKGLVYKGGKVMPFSWACTTTLSNFEANMNYKDIVDQTVTVAFPVADVQPNPDAVAAALTIEQPEFKDCPIEFVAWTTTAWTLPSNLALCVNNTLNYVFVHDTASGHIRIMMDSQIEHIYPPAKKGKKKGKNKQTEDGAEAENVAPYTIVKTVKGEALVGIKYVPPFDYFVPKEGDGVVRTGANIDKWWTVIEGAFVVSGSGTGVVHLRASIW